MTYEESRPGPAMAHQVVLEDRERLMISGVEEVESFDESSILLSTAQGGWRYRARGSTSKNCPWTGAT